MKVLVTCTHMVRDLEALTERFDAYGLEPIAARVPGQHLEGEALTSQLTGCEGVIAGDDQFTRDVFAASPRLRAVAKWGVGVDGIDRVAAADHGVAVSNTPNMFDDDVADVAIAYFIILARDLCRVDSAVRGGSWPKPVGRSLRGATLAIVGLGGIGRATARRALAMGMRVVGTDPAASAAAAARSLGVEVVELATGLRLADVVSLHCPLTSETHHLLDASTLALLRPGALLVNVARGPVVDEGALVDALDDGRVAAAALDVFEREPLPHHSPFRHMQNVVLGSHNASNTREAVARTHRAAIANLARDLGLR